MENQMSIFEIGLDKSNEVSEAALTNKDWIGNNRSVYVCNGASNHSEGDKVVEGEQQTMNLGE